MRSIARLLRLMCLALLFVLTGCGTSSGPTYHIAMDPAWYSIEALGREKNIVGFCTDLLAEIAHITKTRIALRSTNWDTLFEGLKEDQYQGILSGIQPYNFNQKNYEFSDLFLKTGPVLVVNSASKASSLADFSGKEVGAISNSPSIVLMQKYQGILIRNYDSIAKMLNDLAAGAIDGAVLGILPAQGYVQDLYHGVLKIATPPLNEEGLRLVTMKDSADPLMDAFNRGLKKSKADKSYDKILKKWGMQGAFQD